MAREKKKLKSGSHEYGRKVDGNVLYIISRKRYNICGSSPQRVSSFMVVWSNGYDVGLSRRRWEFDFPYHRHMDESGSLPLSSPFYIHP